MTLRAPVLPILTLLALPAGVAGCAASQNGADPKSLQYGPVVVADLGDDLIQVKLSIRAPATTQDITNMAECNAAAYAKSQGFGFTRHLRTNAYKEGGLWRADAVYSVTSELPRGLRPLDTKAVIAACAQNGIPMV
ncbi:MAG: hypothetical protein ACPGFC_03965 [Paracoccaceae bacterium]